MTTFIGEYTAKLDDKGRLAFPAALKKQSRSEEPDRYVLKRDIYEKCLVLYPIEEWHRQTELIRSKINPYNQAHARFLRGFFRGTAEITLDAQNRMILPKLLADKVEIEREIYMAGIDGKIEIWAKHLYEQLDDDMEDFAQLAGEILGNQQL
ncbi:MAG: hypothetical protein RIS47_2295 [Bacteroidota bacterium]|jgi:MraZ protein